MSDPVSRLRFAQQEIDKTFGSNYAREHPEVVNAVMIAASLDWADDGGGGAAQRRPGARARRVGAAVTVPDKLAVAVTLDPARGYVVG